MVQNRTPRLNYLGKLPKFLCRLESLRLCLLINPPKVHYKERGPKRCRLNFHGSGLAENHPSDLLPSDLFSTNSYGWIIGYQNGKKKKRVRSTEVRIVKMMLIDFDSEIILQVTLICNSQKKIVKIKITF